MTKKNVEVQKFRSEAFKERLKKREIWINGPITELLVETLYTNLIKLQEEGPQLPLAVVINSTGGLFYESTVATDIMGTLSCPTKTIALANAVSGGFIIFMGGQQRICHDYTCLMMHSAGMGIGGKVQAIEDKIEYTKYAQEKLSRFLSYQTGGKTTPKYWQALFDSGKDKWFSIEEAIRLGIVHKVVRRKEMVDPTFQVNPPHTWQIKPLKGDL